MASLACFIPLVVFLSLSSGNLQVESCTFQVTNNCPFDIWPATAANQGHPVLANGGFHLPPGRTQTIQAPGDWSGRIWARTGCQFPSTQNHVPACETGDCGGQLECNGLIGTPPATLVELTLQADKKKPSSYDVSLVDGYNLPVQVTSKGPSPKCSISGCKQNLKSLCPKELAVFRGGAGNGEVVACKSACLAFGLDLFCCRNQYGSPEKCYPTLYSGVFRQACPSYVSYAYDQEAARVSCGADEYVVTFCPGKWGTDYSTN